MEKKVAVITGGTKGIGRALVNNFLSNDFIVFTCARSRADIEDENCFFFQADLSKKEDVIAFGDFVQSKASKIDVLINNTGVFIPGQIHNEDEGSLELQINTNLYSAYHLTRKLISGMIEIKKGHIFNICSIASITPYSNGGSYSISKYAMYGMTKCLREEMKEHGVKVTAVLPGAVYTSSWEGADVEEDRLMAPEDISESIYTAYKLSGRTVIEDLILRPQLGDL